MKRTASVSGLLIVTFCALVAMRSGATRAQSGAAPKDGLFTQQQVDRGRAVYAQSCASCHGASLSGGSASTLTGSSFQARWSHVDMKVDDLLSGSPSSFWMDANPGAPTVVIFALARQNP